MYDFVDIFSAQSIKLKTGNALGWLWEANAWEVEKRGLKTGKIFLSLSDVLPK